MALSQVIILVCFIVIRLIGVEKCKLEVRIRSATNRVFQVQIYMNALKMMSERLTFAKKDVWRYVNFEGTQCSSKPLIVKTWSHEGAILGWVPAHQIEAFIDGDGFIELHIEDNLLPSFRNRVNVFCAFGTCA